MTLPILGVSWSSICCRQNILIVRESAWADVRKSIIRNLPESIAILSTWAMDSDSYSRYFMPASNSNNIFLAASPPSYPVNL